MREWHLRSLVPTSRTLVCLNDVSVIDTTTQTFVKTVPVGVGPSALAIAPDGSRVYVAATGFIFVIDAALNTVVTTIPLTTRATGIAITPDGALAYVTFPDTGAVGVIDIVNNTYVTTIALEPTAPSQSPSRQTARSR